MAQTDSGLRYPTTSDLLADTNVYINNLRDDVAGKLAQKTMVVKSQQLVQGDANGFFTLAITDFATLRGVVFQYLGTQSDLYTVTTIITQIAAQSVTAQLWYMDRDVGGRQNRPFNSGAYLTVFAWGDPR